MSDRIGARPRGQERVAWVGLALGPVLALGAYLALPAATVDAAGALVAGLSPQARATGALAALMATWWLTEAIPLSATALLPLVVLPLSGAASIKAAAAPYANEIIFLFLGGFILGLAMERWGLHRRIALLTVMAVGTTPRRLVAGFMIASAMISMWVSNTATALMILPIATSVIALVGSHRPSGGDDPAFGNFACALLLCVAYACSIGGVGTLIGTPPNSILAAYARDHLGVEISMVRWLLLSLPLLAIFLPIAWAYLVFVVVPVRLEPIPGGRKLIGDELRKLGRMSRAEWIVLVTFLATVALWISSPALARLGKDCGIAPLALLNDSSIAIAAALALFIIPVHPRARVFAMDWPTAEKLPWGILILFGGGLSLAAAVSSTGLDAYLGGRFHVLQGAPDWVVIGAVVTIVIFMTELTSNTALTNAILPVLAVAAPTLGIEPLALLVPAAIAASMAFMLPIATPPNAIVFASGRVPLRRMARAGLGLNLIGIILITVLTMLLQGRLSGVASAG